MKKIAIVTATRAEYGLLSPVIKKLREYENIQLRIETVVTGTHLSGKYGNTVEEIKNDGVRIDHQVEISTKSDSERDISCNQAEALIKFTDLFLQQRYNAVIFMGDRYETLPIAIAAGNTGTPIFHLCGGDTTEGAIDEWIRHSITKMSYLHFVTNAESRKRVIELGENPNRVFNYGSTSIDNIINVATMSKTEALESVELDDCKYALCTYLPVTMENNCIDNQMCSFIEVIKSFPEIQFIVTKSNADQGGARINDILDREMEKIGNLHVFTSLGIKRYLSLMRYAEFVLGNSSSGIIEAPVFHIPTVNIGDRQRGRLQPESVINCLPDTDSINEAIRIALSNGFRKVCSNVRNPYGDGHAAEKIAKKTIEFVESGNIDLKKKFFDVCNY